MDTDGALPYDAYCMECGDCHVISLPPNFEEGDTFKYHHVRACGLTSKHEIRSRLDGLARQKKSSYDSNLLEQEVSEDAGKA